MLRPFQNWSQWRRLRYVLVTLAAIGPVWFLAFSYIMLTPPSYEASMTLILPGEGPTASLKLDDMGQASSHSASPWASSRLNPLESYRKLMMTDAVRRRAAASRDLEKDAFPKPKIKLVDQTNLMMVALRGDSRQGAEDNANALLDSFNTELSNLRRDFSDTREGVNRAAINGYKNAVAAAQDSVLFFKQASGLHSAKHYDDMLEHADRLEARLRDIGIERQRLAGEVSALERSLETTGPRAAQALKLRSDLLFQTMLRETAEVRIEYDRARRRYGARHPDFRGIATRYLAAVQAMEARGRALTGLDRASFLAAADLASDGARETLLSTLVEASVRHGGLMAESAEIVDQLKTARDTAMHFASPAAELDRLTRDYRVAEAVFASALARADTIKTDIFSAYPLAQMVELPLAGDKPVSPSRKIGVVAAIGGTIFALSGLALAWLRRPILRWVGGMFLHPGEEIAEAAGMAAPAPAPVASHRVPPPPPRRPPRSEWPDWAEREADDDPLIEIPNQTPPSAGEAPHGPLRAHPHTA